MYFDNWELTEPGGAFVDDGRIVLDDFVYYINTIVITLRAKLMFGGILSPIPDIASFELFTFEFNARELTEGGFDGIPIPQHPGSEPVVLSVPVENYALEVEVAPGTAEPALLDPLGALKITPGEPGRFHVKVHNAGSRVDDFTNFAALLTNNPFADSEMSDLGVERGFNFVVDPNTDRDCVALGGSCLGGGRLRGWPACYADQTLRVPWLSEVIPCIDEDGLGPAGAPRELRDEDGDGWPDEDPSGTGLLYVKRGVQERLWTTLASYEWNNQEQGAFRFMQYGTGSTAVIDGLLAALALAERTGMERVERWDLALTKRLRDGLAKMEGAVLSSPAGPRLSSAITTFRVQGVPARDLQNALWEKKIRVRAQGDDKGVLLSAHVYVAPADIDRVLEVVATLAARGTA